MSKFGSYYKREQGNKRTYLVLSLEIYYPACICMTTHGRLIYFSWQRIRVEGQLEKLYSLEVQIIQVVNSTSLLSDGPHQINSQYGPRRDLRRVSRHHHGRTKIRIPNVNIIKGFREYYPISENIL